MGSEDAGARDFPVCCHAQPWFAPVSTSALAMRGMSGPGTRDGFDRHDILPTRPRGQTPSTTVSIKLEDSWDTLTASTYVQPRDRPRPAVSRVC